MNEQQLAAVKKAVESMTDADRLLEDEGYGRAYQQEAITALQSIISQEALDKKAENARELGLSYDDAVKGGVGIMLGGKRIDPSSIYAEPKIGCVNHDCDKCKAVQEGRDWSLLEATQESLREHMAEIKRLKEAQPAPLTCKHEWFRTGAMEPGECRCIKCGVWNNVAPPAAQPAPVQEPDYWLGFGLQAHTEKPFENATPLYTTPPAAQPALPPMHASGLVAIKTLLSRDPCAHAKVAIEMIDEMLKENT